MCVLGFASEQGNKKDPGVFLLGLPSRTLHLPPEHFKLLNKLLLIVRRYILHNMHQNRLDKKTLETL